MQNITIKELRDKKVDCIKLYYLLKVEPYLRLAGEKEATSIVQKAITDIKVGGAFLIWSSLFRAYNREIGTGIGMSCRTCWENVLNWAIKYEKVDE